MKAYSTHELQMHVILEKEEVRDLDKKPIKGQLFRRRPDNIRSCVLELEIKKGSIREELEVKLDDFPEDSIYETATKYIITVSQRGYDNLVKIGMTGHRVWSTGKVYIFDGEEKCKELIEFT